MNDNETDEVTQSNQNNHEKVTTSEVCCNSRKRVNKVAYVLLAFFLGWIGIHKFYAGKIGCGIIYIIFSWTSLPWIIAIIEGIIALTKPADKDGFIDV